MEPSVEASTRRSIALLEELGAEVAETSLPHTTYSLAVYYILAPSECSANLARYDGVKYGFSDRESESMWDALEQTRGQGFGPEVKRRIMLGTYALSAGYYDAFYLKAQQVRTIIRREFETEFEKFDAIVSATSPTVAFRLGEKTSDPLQMYLSDILTLPANIAGIPGISVPARTVGRRDCQSASRYSPGTWASRRCSGSRTHSSRHPAGTAKGRRSSSLTPRREPSFRRRPNDPLSLREKGGVRV